MKVILGIHGTFGVVLNPEEWEIAQYCRKITGKTLEEAIMQKITELLEEIKK